jgi:hypothetical protein
MMSIATKQKWGDRNECIMMWVAYHKLQLKRQCIMSSSDAIRELDLAIKNTEGKESPESTQAFRVLG